MKQFSKSTSQRITCGLLLWRGDGINLVDTILGSIKKQSNNKLPKRRGFSVIFIYRSLFLRRPVGTEVDFQLTFIPRGSIIYLCNLFHEDANYREFYFYFSDCFLLPKQSDKIRFADMHTKIQQNKI